MQTVTIIRHGQANRKKCRLSETGLAQNHAPVSGLALSFYGGYGVER